MTDWASIVSNLEAAYGRRELARLAASGVTTLADLRNKRSTEPRHALGVRLLSIYAQQRRKEPSKRG